MNNMLSRRDWMKTAAAVAATVRSGEAATLPAIGVQLYTVRNVILKDPAQTLKTIDQIGYREAEVVIATLDKIWDALNHLKPVSAHIDTALFKPENKEKLP